MLTPFEGFLAAMADSDLSAPFYVTSLFQMTLLFLGVSKTISSQSWYRVLVGIALLILPTLLVFGIYFAMLPVA